MIEERPIPWQELVETLFRRRRTILLLFAAGLVVGALMAWLPPPLYRAEATILLTAQPVSGPREDAMSSTQISTELALLTSPSLIRSVLEDYQEQGVPIPAEAGLMQQLKGSIVQTVLGLYWRLRGGEQSPPTERAVQSLIYQVKAVPVNESNVVEVSYTSSDPQWAARFVNDLLVHHVERIAQLNEQSGAQQFFEGQRNLLGERLKDARDALAAFRNEHGADLAGGPAQLAQVITELEASRVSTETRILELTAKAEFLNQELADLPQTVAAESRVTENEAVTFLRSRIIELEIQRTDLLARYLPTSSRVQELDQQIASAQKLLDEKEGDTLEETRTSTNPAYQTLRVDLVQTRAELTASEARAQALLAQLAQYREKHAQQEGLAAEIERLENEVTTARDTYQAYLQKEEEARFSSALDASRIVNVSTVDPAEVPRTPVPSKRSVRLLVGGAVGLVLGLLLAFFRDWSDPSVKGAVQAARVAGVRVLAEIPAVRRA